MAISNLNGDYQKLLVSPFKLKQELIEKIRNEMEHARSNQPANIIMKMNSLTDRDLINMLKEASCAGVKIKLIIRGICCIIPGLPGKLKILKLLVL